ncbi:hypothetical protein TEA_028689 [Camellia sinensis var. sinensis]|uniref:SRP54-type proteins GTP-binding domain-containing protein n=1 Tax=Camellia sinensis var. sinensis TaxID=542762 RepID=A0A4V3WPB7_CAMSN|nr:hypothetical protein TEA_028689 [Camellia sinensis var. sinensis]
MRVRRAPFALQSNYTSLSRRDSREEMALCRISTRAVFEECQSLGKVEADGKNKVGAGIGPHEHLLLAVEALKAEGLNKQQVLTVVAKTVDDIFATQVGGSLNQGASREKGRCIRNDALSALLIGCFPTSSHDFNVLPLPYLKVGYLTAPPVGNPVAPHSDWKRTQFILNHEGLQQVEEVHIFYSTGAMSSSPSSLHGRPMWHHNGVHMPSLSRGHIHNTTACLDEPYLTVVPQAHTSFIPIRYAQEQPGAPLNPGHTSTSLSWEQGLGICCLGSSEDCGLEARIMGLSIDTIHGPVFLIADSWESLDGWLDAIRLVYTIFARGKSDVMAEIARQGLEKAKRKNMDVVIVDTAGRLQIDKTMMDELKEVKRALNPTEILLVVDAMTGQEAAARLGSLESLQQLVEVARNPAANPTTLFAVFVREDNTRQATEQKAPGLCAASMEDYNIVESMEPDPTGFREGKDLLVEVRNDENGMEELCTLSTLGPNSMISPIVLPYSTSLVPLSQP